MVVPNMDGIFQLLTVAMAVIINQQPVITLTEFSWLTEQLWNTFEPVTWNVLYILTWGEAVDMSVPWGTYILIVRYIQLKSFLFWFRKIAQVIIKALRLPPTG